MGGCGGVGEETLTTSGDWGGVGGRVAGFETSVAGGGRRRGVS